MEELLLAERDMWLSRTGRPRLDVSRHRQGVCSGQEQPLGEGEPPEDGPPILGQRGDSAALDAMPRLPPATLNSKGRFGRAGEAKLRQRLFHKESMAETDPKGLEHEMKR